MAAPQAGANDRPLQSPINRRETAEWERNIQPQSPSADLPGCFLAGDAGESQPGSAKRGGEQEV